MTGKNPTTSQKESTQTLMRFLFTIVANKQASQAATKQTLMDALRADPVLRDSLFSHLNPNLESKEPAQELTSDKIDMDTELRDTLRETEFRIKLSSFKTPPGSADNVPSQVYAVFKLFNNKSVQSDTLTLHRTDS